MKNLVLLLAIISCAYGQEAYATCQLLGTADTNIVGNIFFYQPTPGANVTVTVEVTGIPAALAGTLGIHLHSFGDISDRTTAVVSAGGHYNPLDSVHGCPEVDGDVRHIGDLGNWDVVSDGTIASINQTKTVNLLQLSGEYSAVGRSFILHGLADPCTGGSMYGPRIASCTVGIQNTTLTAAAGANAAVNTNAQIAAFCYVQPIGSSIVYGGVWFTTNGTHTTVVGHFFNMTGIHGIHVHQYGDLRGTDGLASGSHWNPTATTHGIPPFNPRHVGDMGNIYSYDSNGTAWYWYVNDNLPLSGANSIIGRTLTIHTSPDICTPPVGGAGSRIAQCVVGLVNITYNEVPAVPVGIENIQNITACTNLYTVTSAASTTVATSGTSANNGTTNGTTVATSAPATTVIATTTTADALSMAPLAFLVLAILFFSM